MSNSSMTPGPWHIEPLQATNGADMAICAPANGWVVAVIQHDPDIQDVEEPDHSTVKWHPADHANACAIAETPALVEALRAVLAWADRSGIADSDPPEYVNARAILARIDGAAPTTGTGTATGGIEPPTYDTEGEGVTVHYTVRGGMDCPPGSVANPAGSGVVLPDGRILKVWEAFELQDGDQCRDLDSAELSALGITYQCGGTELEFEGEC